MDNKWIDHRWRFSSTNLQWILWDLQAWDLNWMFLLDWFLTFQVPSMHCNHVEFFACSFDKSGNWRYFDEIIVRKDVAKPSSSSVFLWDFANYWVSQQVLHLEIRNWNCWKISLKFKGNQCYQTGQFKLDKNWWKMQKIEKLKSNIFGDF